jgi:lysophospholipase L1-like esterase
MDYRKIIFALALFVIFQNCTKQDTPSVSQTEYPPIIKQDTTIRYLALGDSYTIGERVTTPERYPEQLVEALRLSGIKTQSLRIIARTGWTTDELSNAMDDAKINDSTYTMVSLLIGVNNQYRNRSIDSYTPQFETLLKRAIELAGGKKEKVFVVSIPDYAYTPFGNGNTQISSGIDTYNAVNKDIAQKYGVQYFNITPISREGLTDKALVATDGLHPSGKQYSRWVSLMLEDVKKLSK